MEIGIEMSATTIPDTTSLFICPDLSPIPVPPQINSLRICRKITLASILVCFSEVTIHSCLTDIDRLVVLARKRLFISVRSLRSSDPTYIEISPVAVY
jgi:hypothetical protein